MEEFSVKKQKQKQKQKQKKKKKKKKKMDYFDHSFSAFNIVIFVRSR